MGRGARVGPSPRGGDGGPGGFPVGLGPVRGTALARLTLPSSGWPRQRSHCGPVGCCSAQWLLRGCFRCKAKPSEWGGKAGGWQGPQEAGRALMPAPPEKVFEPPIRGGAGRGSGDWVPSGVHSQEAAATRVTLGGQTPAPNRVLKTLGLHGLFNSSKERLPGCPSQELTPAPWPSRGGQPPASRSREGLQKLQASREHAGMWGGYLWPEHTPSLHPYAGSQGDLNRGSISLASAFMHW